MKLQKSFILLIALTLSLITVFASAAAAQVTQQRPALVINKPLERSIASGNNLYCAGYIQSNGINTDKRIVGAKDETDKYNYAQNDFLYINVGSRNGVNVGDLFSVVRPRGQVESKWTSKKVGFYVQEVGAVEVVRVKGDVSVARVKTSCDVFLLGDLVQPVERRSSPIAEPRPPLDLFADPSGKARGRILMSRDGAEAIAKDFIVYVDLGAEDNVHYGDHLTIFRPLDKGNLFLTPDREDVSARDRNFESDTYRGGRFSNQAGRKEGDKTQGKVVTTRMAKEGRPADLRKVVGEGVVLNVKERTATVVITRNAQEIHTGDWVEIQ